MALSIKTEEADRLARELARRTGESMTQAVTRALRERLERLPPVNDDETESFDDFLKRAQTFFKGTRTPTKEDFDALWEE